MSKPMNIVMLGLSITSSWGNGHATVYRALVRALVRLGHQVLFLERDTPWYAANRDLPYPPFGHTYLYQSVDELIERFSEPIQQADLVMVGSFVPDGVAIGQWVTQTTKGISAFYDIDTPVTLSCLEQNQCDYIDRDLVGAYDLYLSFTGGQTIRTLEQQYGSPMARPLYCCFDPDLYYPEAMPMNWDLGYMGTYSEDRQLPLQHLMLEAARRWRQGRFVVAGPQYPANITWPGNVQRIEHLPPGEHRAFYNRQRFALNLTRAAMVQAGFAPSVRLFEAAACGTTIISDYWHGLDTFFEIGRDILIARTPDDVLRHLCDIPEDQRVAIGLRARQRVLTAHTAAHRAAELLRHVRDSQQAKLQAAHPPRSLAEENLTLENTTRSAIDLGPWQHNLRLPNDVQTASDSPQARQAEQLWEKLQHHLPDDLTDWTVLDVHCSSGLFSLELAKRGAQVLAIDPQPHHLEQVGWASRQLNLTGRIRLERMYAYDVARLHRPFDLVLMLNVLDHLRYPLLGLDLAAEKVRRMMLLHHTDSPRAVGTQRLQESQARSHIPGFRQAGESSSQPSMTFIEPGFDSHPARWWSPNLSAMHAMLRSAGLEVTSQQEGLYVCEVDPDDASPARTSDRAELLAATGRMWQHLGAAELVT